MQIRAHIRVHAIVTIVLLATASGCRAPVLQIEQPGDAARFRTWDFVKPRRGEVYAPALVDVNLERSVARHVGHGLSARGFERSGRAPDLLVYFQLGIRVQTVVENVAGGVEYLSSHHSSPSFEVQSTQTEERHYENAELVVLLIDPNERRLVWRGNFSQRYREAFRPHLGEAVGELLAKVPRSGAAERVPVVIVREEGGEDVRLSHANWPSSRDLDLMLD